MIMSASNEPELKGRRAAFSWALYDAAPRWLRQYLWSHPYDVTVGVKDFSAARRWDGDTARRFVWRSLERNRDWVATEALRLYGPTHPQAARASERATRQARHG